jgi:hypothetical protein
VRPGALAQREIALRRELGVGVDGNPPRHAQLAGQVAGGRHARPGSQRALADRPPELVLDLRAQRPGRFAAHRDQQLDRLTGLVYSHRRGSSICTSATVPSRLADSKTAGDGIVILTQERVRA